MSASTLDGALHAPRATLSRPAARPPATAHPELGSLLAMLLVMMDEGRSVVVHVTAASPGAGTSTVARAVAAAVAASGWKDVALVDATGRADLPCDDLLDAATRGEAPRLLPGQVNGSPVSTGAFSPASAPAARMGAVRGLYAQLRTRYALTVVDCPPVLPDGVLPDGGAAVLGSAADGTVLVVEAERTRVAAAHRARELLDQVGAPLLGVVLNKRRTRVPRVIGRFL